MLGMSTHIQAYRRTAIVGTAITAAFTKKTVPT